MTGSVAARAAMTTSPGILEVVDVTVAAPAPHEIRVAIAASGVCRTDEELLSIAGMIPGHEGAGVVDAVGADVEHVRVGDRVLLNWAMSCGTCFYCARGQTQLCEVGSPLHAGPGARAHDGSTLFRGRPVSRSFGLGTLSTMTLVPERAVTPLPDRIPAPSAAIMGCAVMTGFGSAVNAARVRAGDAVAVLGVGAVGLNVIQGARIAGAGRIIAIGRNADKLEASRRFGATDVIPFSSGGTDDLAEEVRSLTGGRGADAAFECTGAPTLALAPLALVRHGGIAVLVSGAEGELTIDMSALQVNKTLVYTLYGDCNPARDFPAMFELYDRGALLLDELITTSHPLEATADAFADLRRGAGIKSVVTMA